MRTLLTFTALLALAACGATPTPVAHADVCLPERDGATVQTEGYFAVGRSVFCSNTGSSDLECGFEFVASPDETAGFTADVAQGDGNNQVQEIPDDYTAETIQFTADDGSTVRIGDHVQISGRLLVGQSDVCIVNVDKIVPLR
jgi:hypothetical protein